MQTNWQLEKYFYNSISDKNLTQDIENLTKLVESFIYEYKGKITDLNTLEMKTFLEKEADLSSKFTKIFFYLSYLQSLDTQNQEVLKKNGEMEILATKLSNDLLFISQELKEMGYEKLIEISKQKELSDYQNYFYQTAENIKYLLDEKTEKALNLASLSGGNAFVKLYEELTGSFEFRLSPEIAKILNKSEMVTFEEIWSLKMHTKEEVRKASVESINEVFGSLANQIVLGNTYNSVVKDWSSQKQIRGFETVMSKRNISEEMPNEVIDLLLSTTKENYHIYQRFLKIKAKFLGYEKFKTWNLSAPISDVETKIEFEKGVKIVQEVLENFDSEFAKFFVEMFESGRVDVFPKKGKRGGAFASYEKNFHSFVMLNYTDTVTDVSTIAHEIGHAFHGYLSQKQPQQVYDSVLCLAETASVFTETLLANKLLEVLETKMEKANFLNDYLGGIMATIFTQVRYVSFEKEIHESIDSGKDLNYQDFNKIWRQKTAEQYGGMVEFSLSEDKDIGWSVIPHIFHTPFYCYSYAFGNLLSLSLFSQYQKEGASFIPKYKEILSKGSSQTPYNMLIENGIDIKSKDFYENGFLAISKLLDEFEELAG
jgi:oligoendopeptidase F